MTAFYIKCAQCGDLYDGKHMGCPNDGCERITKRIFWSRADYDREQELKDGERGL